MQFKVPQNLDLEDKIFGPLTLVQFLYVLGGLTAVYILYQTVHKISSVLFWFLAIPTASLALGIAFLKIQEQPLMHFIAAGLAYLANPKDRVWHRDTQEAPPVFTAPPPKTQVEHPVKKQPGKTELERLSYALDTQPIGATYEREKKLGFVTKTFEEMLKAGKIKAPKNVPDNMTQN